MGWKNVKEHYRIGHTVQVTDKGICIGSLYIHDIIVIGPDGEFVKRYRDSSNEDLLRYQREMDADPGTLKRLVVEPDRFEQSIVVYTWDGVDIIEKHCEALGFPNVTHDGDLMYENTFSEDKLKVFRWAKKDAEGYIQSWGKQLEDARARVEKCHSEIEKHKSNLRKLVTG